MLPFFWNVYLPAVGAVPSFGVRGVLVIHTHTHTREVPKSSSTSKHKKKHPHFHPIDVMNG